MDPMVYLTEADGLSYCKALFLATVVLSLPAVLLGCGSEEGAGKVLSVEEVKSNLRQLPYRFHFKQVDLPKGAEEALAGRAEGRYNTVLNFGVSFGRSPDGVPVPRAGTAESLSYRDGDFSFLFTSDLQIPTPKGAILANPSFKTIKQWREANYMEVNIIDNLCLAYTGDHCRV